MTTQPSDCNDDLAQRNNQCGDIGLTAFGCQAQTRGLERNAQKSEVGEPSHAGLTLPFMPTRLPANF